MSYVEKSCRNTSVMCAHMCWYLALQDVYVGDIWYFNIFDITLDFPLSRRGHLILRCRYTGGKKSAYTGLKDKEIAFGDHFLIVKLPKSSLSGGGGGAKAPHLSPLGALPPDPRWGQAQRLPVSFGWKNSAYTHFNYHNFLNAAAPQILLTSL